MLSESLYSWNLALLMELNGVQTADELTVRVNAEQLYVNGRAVQVSVREVEKLLSTAPLRLDPGVLWALAVVLNCSLEDLIWIRRARDY